VDSNNLGTVPENWLIAPGDRFVGSVVDQITFSSMWKIGNNAIIITFDESNGPLNRIATIVAANHGPRGVIDPTRYNHYSLLASTQQAFGLSCLLKSCSASAMTPLFAITGSTSIRTLPPPYNFPISRDKISAQGPGRQAAPVSLSGSGWIVEPSYNFDSNDNVLAGVSAASATDAWAVGTYYPPPSTSVLAALAHHFDGTRWTAYALPDVGCSKMPYWRSPCLRPGLPGR
jgi:hypothetical protein